ncbi:MAG: Asp23/Gls24 family envelope stress response protein [Eubacteriales bacterium]|nr:Asp23/Gls24 family envelope stress response protein [Eubacteriales bacterium]
MAKEEIQSNFTVTSVEELGQVQISNEVITIIAGLAATEVKGVTSMAGNITNELVGKLGVKNLSKGVKINIDENRVYVDLALNLDYGFSIPKTCQKVQEKVKASIENMTGLEVETVNIKIANVTMESGK